MANLRWLRLFSILFAPSACLLFLSLCMLWQVTTPPRNQNRRTQGRIDLSKMEVRLPSTTQAPPPCPPRAALPHLRYRYSGGQRSTRTSSHRALAPGAQAASLRRYRKVHKLGESPPGSSKEELLPAVARHFAAQANFFPKQHNIHQVGGVVEQITAWSSMLGRQALCNGCRSLMNLRR